MLQQVVNALIATAILGPTAYAFALSVGTSKIFNFGLGGLIGLSGAVMYQLQASFHLPLLVCVIVTVLAVGALSSAIYLWIYEPVLRKSKSLVPVLIMSIGILTVLSYVASLLLENTTQQLDVTILQGVLRLGPVTVPEIAVAAALVSLVLIAAVEIGLASTRFGRALRAVSDDSALADVLGIPPRRVITASYFISGALVAVVVFFSSALGSVDSFAGESLVLLAMVATIIGGLGRRLWSLVGALIIGLIQNLSLTWISGIWQNTVAFALLVLVLMFLPRGIAGSRMSQRV